LCRETVQFEPGEFLQLTEVRFDLREIGSSLVIVDL
jgi:hypothetical protein